MHIGFIGLGNMDEPMTFDPARHGGAGVSFLNKEIANHVS